MNEFIEGFKDGLPDAHTIGSILALGLEIFGMTTIIISLVVIVVILSDLKNKRRK